MLSEVLAWTEKYTSLLNGVSAISSGIMALAAVLALGVAVKQLSGARKLAQIQHLLTVAHSFSQPPISDYRVRAARSTQKGELDSTELWEVLDFFETVGLLMKRGYLNPEDVWEMFSYIVFPLYCATKPLIEEQKRDDPNALSNFVYMHSQLCELERKHLGTCDSQSAEQLEIFWREEANLIPGTPLRKHSRKKELSAAATPNIG